MNRIGLACVALLVWAPTALAVPNALNYQGQLFLNGNPTSGPVSITFRMFAAPTGGTELWTETDVVTVTGGLFSTTLGDGTAFPADLFTSQVPWLEMEVNGTVLTPRTRFQSVPYALNTPATGGNELWLTNGTDVWRAAGKVGIGTDTPVHEIEIHGSTSTIMLSGPTGYETLTLNQETPTHSTIKADFQTVSGSGNTGTNAAIEFEREASSNESSIFMSTGQNLTRRLVVTGNGNVGIGTANPGSISWFGDPALVVSGVRPTLSLATNTAGGLGTIQFAGPQSQFHVNYGDAVNPFLDLSQVRIYGNGYVGIGTQNPTAKLHVVGDFTATGTKCREVDDPSYGKLYFNAVESGRALFTTSGRAKLIKGKARIVLDPKWMAGVTIDRDHPLDVSSVVFYGRHGNWHVEPDATGFDVYEADGSTVEFFWTVQASQKGYEDLYLNRVEQTAAK